ncbi:MAG: hypothetical protein M3Y40_00670 [Chloroflexota bacterium]|nr:hypothetical protein [Chloroflexota bacterium]
MTDETVDCFNCGRANPEWAQVCRSCGVALRHGEERIVPTGPFPTDQTSPISIGAVIGTILAAVLIGLFVSSLNTTDGTVVQATPTPSPTVEPSIEPSVEPSVEPSIEATPEPTPTLRGTLAFGTGLDNAGNVTGATDTFTPSTSFAYALSIPEGPGAAEIRNEITRVEGEEVVANDPLPVDPADEVIGYNLGSAAGFVQDWGPGEYVWRIYVGEELVAEATFRLSEG